MDKRSTTFDRSGARPVTSRITLSRMLAYSSASLGMGIFYAFNNFTLPLFLRSYTSNDALIGILSSTRSFEGAIVQPVIGAWSDRVWTPMGRRKPFFILGMPFVVALLVYCSFRPSFPLLIAAILLFTLIFNIGVDPYIALQSDIAPPGQRSTLNSVATLFIAVGQLSFALISGLILWDINPAYCFYFVGGGLFLTYLITSAGIKERRENVEIREPMKLKEHLKTLPNYPDAMKFFVSQLLLWFGINAATPFLTLFASREVPGVSAGVAQILAALLLGLTALCAVPVGIMGDKVSRKRLLQVGLGIFGISALIVAFFVRSLPLLVVFIITIGIGNTFHTVLSYPLLTKLAPPERIGEFWGINTFFSSSGAIFSAALAGWLADIFGTYRAVFVLTGVCMIAALVVLQFVNSGKPVFRDEVTPEDTR